MPNDAQSLRDGTDVGSVRKPGKTQQNKNIQQGKPAGAETPHATDKNDEPSKPRSPRTALIGSSPIPGYGFTN